MSTKLTIYSEKDIKRMVKEEVKKRFYSFERLLNSLKGRLLDIEKIVSFMEKRK